MSVAVIGAILLLASLIVPTLLLIQLDDDDLNRWSDIGQAVSPVEVFFSGAAFIDIALTLSSKAASSPTRARSSR